MNNERWFGILLSDEHGFKSRAVSFSRKKYREVCTRIATEFGFELYPTAHEARIDGHSALYFEYPHDFRVFTCALANGKTFEEAWIIL